MYRVVAVDLPPTRLFLLIPLPQREQGRRGTPWAAARPALSCCPLKEKPPLPLCLPYTACRTLPCISCLAASGSATAMSVARPMARKPKQGQQIQKATELGRPLKKGTVGRAAGGQGRGLATPGGWDQRAPQTMNEKRIHRTKRCSSRKIVRQKCFKAA